LVVLSDGETTRGRPTADGAKIAADAKVPVYTIAFGTDHGVIANPSTGADDPVPVKLDELQNAADTTSGKAYVAPSADELAKAYADIRSHLQQSVGDAVTTIHELTWRYVLAAVVLMMLAWGLGLWWLRGRCSADQSESATAAAASLMRWARASVARFAAILFIT
jgi:Ca-activated chloride channel family protein